MTGRPSYAPGLYAGSSGLVSRERHGRVRVARVWSTTFNRANMVGRLANYGTYLLSSIAGAFAVPNPDVVVALTDPPPIGLIGAWAAKLLGVPFVLVTKDIFPDVAVQLGVLRNRTVIAGLRAVKSTLFKNADRVVSIGQRMDKRLEQLGVPPEKIVRIYDWCDGTLVRPLDAPSALRAEHEWSEKFVVMHSGNVGLSQGLDSVLDAAALLRDERDVIFVLVGDGALKLSLQSRVERERLTNVVFLPYQDKTDLSTSLGAADVHIVSLRRGLGGYIVPSKVYGILAAGRPFIAAVEEDSEPRIIADEYGCGVAVSPDNPRELADAIVSMRDHADLDAMGKRAREALETQFDRPIATTAYQQLLESLVGTSTTPNRRGSGDVRA